MTKTHMAAYEVFIGVWNTTGEVVAPDDAERTSLVATDTYLWLPGKHFMLYQVDGLFGDAVTRSIEVMGYDSKRKKHFSQSYDDRGVSESFMLELRGRRWAITGASVTIPRKL